MNRAIRLINLALRISIISLVCFRNVDGQFSGLDEYNEFVQIKLNSINNYLQTNLIDLNTFSGYLYKLNDYLTFYPMIDGRDEVREPTDICLANRTEVCWHIDDSIDIIDPRTPNEPLKWFTTVAYNLNTINLNNLNLHTLNSLNRLPTFSLNDTLNGLSSLNNLASLDSLASLSNLNVINIFNVNRAAIIAYFDKFDTVELKHLLVCLNLFMPFVCSALLFMLCIQNQHRRKIVELNQLFRKIECVSGLQQIKEDMRSLANVIDELRLDAKQNQELKVKLQQMINNEFKHKQLCNPIPANGHPFSNQQFDLNGNQIRSNKGDHESTFGEQIGRINQQLKLNQLEQSKLKYMVCKTIESFDRILNKMKNNCELINS